MTTAVKVRDALVDVLRLDLVGPEPGGVHEAETLSQPPSRWYLTGFLVPAEAPESQRADETANEQLALVPAAGGGDDEGAPEPPSGRRVLFPASMGVSVRVARDVRSLHAAVHWGEYAFVPAQDVAAGAMNGAAGAGAPAEPGATRGVWRRAARCVEVEVAVPASTARPIAMEVLESGGLRLVTSVRPVGLPECGDEAAAELLPEGTGSVSVFLVNHRRPAADERRGEAWIFQAGIALWSETPFVPRPDVRGHGVGEWDERVAELQYRDTFEHAVGHGVATRAARAADGSCGEVASAWIPSAEVKKVEPARIPGVELAMDRLAALAGADEARAALANLPAAHEAWIDCQRALVPAERHRAGSGDP